MDLNRLTQGEKIIGGAGLLLLITSFLSFWAKVEIPGLEGLGLEGVGGGSARFSAWSDAYNILLKLALLLVIVAVVLTVIRASGSTIKLPLGWGQLYLIVCGLAAVILVLMVITGPRGGGGGFGVEISRGPLVFVGAALGLAMAYGAWSHMQSEGTVTTTTPPTFGGPAAPPPPPMR